MEILIFASESDYMNYLEQKFTQRTLLVTTPGLEEFGISFFSEKLSVRSDATTPAERYIELERFMMERSVIFTSPYHLKEATAFLQKLQSERRYRLKHAYTVQSIYNHNLLVTLDTPQGFLELECYRYRPGYAYLKLSMDSGLNSRTCELLGLKKTNIIERLPGDTSQLLHIALPPALKVHSIEVKGHHYIGFPELPEDASYWTPAPDKTSTGACLFYNYENKQVYTEISYDERTGRGRRTSNGWVNEFESYHAKGMRYLSTRQELKEFLERLPEILQEAGITVSKIRHSPDNSEKGMVYIGFNEAVNFYLYHRALGLQVHGNCISYDI